MRGRALAVAVLAGLVAVPHALVDADGHESVGGSVAATETAERLRNAHQVGVPTPPPTTVPTPRGASAEALAILALVNAERAAHGLSQLQLEGRLITAAQLHTADQAAAGDIYHVAPDGTGPGDRIAAVGYVFSAWGENVAAGFPTPEAVMDAWMNSPGHCRNILNPTYTELGVGYVATDSGYRTYWTQKFGRQRGVESPPGTFDPAWC